MNFVKASNVPLEEELPQVCQGEWIRPVRHGFRMRCCDCGLIHRMDFRIMKNRRGKRRIEFRAFREDLDGAPGNQG